MVNSCARHHNATNYTTCRAEFCIVSFGQEQVHSSVSFQCKLEIENIENWKKMINRCQAVEGWFEFWHVIVSFFFIPSWKRGCTYWSNIVDFTIARWERVINVTVRWRICENTWTGTIKIVQLKRVTVIVINWQL